MDIMKRLTLKKKRNDKRLKGRPDNSFLLIKNARTI